MTGATPTRAELLEAVLHAVETPQLMRSGRGFAEDEVEAVLRSCAERLRADDLDGLAEELESSRFTPVASGFEAVAVRRLLTRTAQAVRELAEAPTTSRSHRPVTARPSSLSDLAATLDMEAKVVIDEARAEAARILDDARARADTLLESAGTGATVDAERAESVRRQAEEALAEAQRRADDAEREAAELRQELERRTDAEPASGGADDEEADELRREVEALRGARAEADGARAEAERLREALAAAEHGGAEADGARAEVERLREAVAEAERARAEAERRQAESQRHLDPGAGEELREEVSRLQAETSTARDELDRLHQNLAAVRASIAEAEQERDEGPRPEPTDVGAEVAAQRKVAKDLVASARRHREEAAAELRAAQQQAAAIIEAARREAAETVAAAQEMADEMLTTAIGDDASAAGDA